MLTTIRKKYLKFESHRGIAYMLSIASYPMGLLKNPVNWKTNSKRKMYIIIIIFVYGTGNAYSLVIMANARALYKVPIVGKYQIITY